MRAIKIRFFLVLLKNNVKKVAHLDMVKPQKSLDFKAFFHFLTRRNERELALQTNSPRFYPMRVTNMGTCFLMINATPQALCAAK